MDLIIKRFGVKKGVYTEGFNLSRLKNVSFVDYKK
jgi:hypothetical protein